MTLFSTNIKTRKKKSVFAANCLFSSFRGIAGMISRHKRNGNLLKRNVIITSKSDIMFSAMAASYYFLSSVKMFFYHTT